MDFLFFDSSGKPLFTRNDAEEATWTQEEMSVYLLFPYDAGKEIERGQRVGFMDDFGIFQTFEIRKAKTYEPDHYQEIHGEHIAISELTDEHVTAQEFDDETAQTALSTILTGTLWSVGNVTASNISSAHVGMGNVWQTVRTIEKNWNVYITPRVTVSAAGITGRYLDIAPAGGVWRGVRLSLDKNMDEVGVTWDDSNVKTALYGYGKNAGDAPLTFADEVWTVSGGDPADKPDGQTYVEDAAATAAYGRNGRARFGFYQNGDIDDPEILLQKTWEALQAVKEPEVSIDCMVRDLHRLGYADQPMRLHDTAQVEIRPTGTVLNREIIKLTVDLIDPTATRPTIGAYIPNIIYIARENDRGGGGGSGGQNNLEYELAEFETQISANSYNISLKAWQRDLEHTNENLLLAYAAIGISSSQIQSIVTGSGVVLDPNTGEIMTDANGNPIFAPGSKQLWSQVQVDKDKIALVVTGEGANAQINAASIVAAVNDSGSTVQLDADKIYLNGQVIVGSHGGLGATNGDFTNLYAGSGIAFAVEGTDVRSYRKLYAEGGIEALDGASVVSSEGQFYSLLVGSPTPQAATWKSISVVASSNLSASHDYMYLENGVQRTQSGRLAGGTTTIYYLGHS